MDITDAFARVMAEDGVLSETEIEDLSTWCKEMASDLLETESSAESVGVLAMSLHKAFEAGTVYQSQFPSATFPIEMDGTLLNAFMQFLASKVEL